MTTDLRPSPIAGLWYEGDPKVLARTVDAYMDQAQLPELKGEVIAQPDGGVGWLLHQRRGCERGQYCQVEWKQLVGIGCSKSRPCEL